MRAAVNVVLASAVLVWSALAAIQTLPSIASAAEREAQQGEGRWVPSLALTSGITLQKQAGEQSSFLFDGETDPTVARTLRLPKFDDDRVVSPYVGAAVELMTPALRLPSSPRAFVSGEILPTFASERLLALDGEPSRITGPEVGAVLAVEEDITHFTSGPPAEPGPRQRQFGEREANGQGMRTAAQIDHLVLGAKLGVAFAFEFRGRQLRIKPSAGWIHYEVEVKGYLVDPTCSPATRCTNIYINNNNGTPMDTSDDFFQVNPPPGFLRESILSGSDSREFDGFGPGVDLEMDTGRVGPLGTSLFLGVHGYYIIGDRDIAFGASQSYDDQLSPSAAVDTQTASWRVRVAPWMYRAGLGIRFQWLGSSE